MNDNTFTYPIENQIASAKGRMNRAWRIKQDLLGQFALANTEYSRAYQEYRALDRMRAEQNITHCPPAGEPKKRKKKESSAESIGALVSVLDSMTDQEKRDMIQALENKAKG